MTDELNDRLDELVDLHEFVTFWAMESLIGFWDGYSGNQNNFFVYTIIKCSTHSYKGKKPKKQF